MYSVKVQTAEEYSFLLTAFAICMGAPFWFDLLNKLVHLRATGKKKIPVQQANTMPRQITLHHKHQ